MRFSVINATPNAEETICRAGRGDMLDGYVGHENGAPDFILNNDYTPIEGSHFDNNFTFGQGQTFEQIMEAAGEPKDYHLEEAEAIYGEDYTELQAKKVKLIHKFFDQEHWGVFEHPQITIAVEGMTRVAMAQITRHRHLTFDVQSQRYVNFADKDPVMPVSIMSKNDTHFNRQDGMIDLDASERARAREIFQEVMDDEMSAYNALTAIGVPEEDARFVLGTGMPVNMTISGNPRAFMHVVNLRAKPNAQWEAQMVAEGIFQCLARWMPITFSTVRPKDAATERDLDGYI